jgi:hypothetical protein
MTSVGFPHSDISGSTPACDSPELFAANHVLHRLLTPRHPSCALSSLTTNLLWTELDLRRGRSRFAPRKLAGGNCHQNFATRRLQGRDRSSAKELRLWISFDARFLKDTLSRRRLFLNCQRPDSQVFRTCDERSRTITARYLSSKVPWSVRDSNPRPPACKADALPAELTPRKAFSFAMHRLGSGGPGKI